MTDSFPPPSPFVHHGASSHEDIEVLEDVKIGLWHGSRVRGEAGIEVAKGTAVYSMFEIPAVPNFKSSRFPDIAELEEAARLAIVGEKQSKFLSALHQLGPQTAVSLRYYYSKKEGEDGRIRVFLVGRSFGADESTAKQASGHFRDVVVTSFPNEYRIKAIDHDASSKGLDKILTLDGVRSIIEVIKSEQVLRPRHDPQLCGFSFYYRPGEFHSKPNSMVSFCSSLVKSRVREAMVDICLIPANPLTEVERGELKNWSVICQKWSREQRIKQGGGLFSDATEYIIQPDPVAEQLKREYEQLESTYGSNERMFTYAIRVVSWDQEPAHVAAIELLNSSLQVGSASKSILLDESDLRFQKALNAARLCSISPSVCESKIWQHEEAPESLRRLHRLVTIDEIEGFFRVPIPGREGCPGIKLDDGLSKLKSHDSGPKEDLVLGSYIDGHRVTKENVTFPIQGLTKSALVVGAPGSGKTTFCFSLLTQLWEKFNIPFIVLEPAKSEYRSLLDVDGFDDDLWIFTIGNERVSPFRLNPFEILDGVSVSEHISSLITCFSAAFSLWDPLPMIVDRAIREAYAERGWSEYAVGGEEPNLEAPTLEDFYKHALKQADSMSYQGETAGNIRGALEVRLGSLLSGPKGRCFNSRSSVPLKMIMERPVIFELDALNEEEKALMMMFVLVLIREYAKANRKSGSPLKHVLLVEEAHNLIGRGDSGGGENQSNAKSVAIQFFTRMLAEMRALGEGIVVADQLPTAIAVEAIKNTNLKIMHRLVSLDDRQELGQSMVLNSGQIEQSAILAPGQSMAFMEGWSESRLILEPNFKVLYCIEEPPEDSCVDKVMESVRTRDYMIDAFLPFEGCKAACTRCDPKLREIYERRVKKILSSMQQKGGTWTKSSWSTNVGNLYFSDREESWEKDPGKFSESIARNCMLVHFDEKLVYSKVTGKTDDWGA